jgi:hypothetical protein
MRNLFCISVVGLVLSACGGDSGPSLGPESDPTPTQQTAISTTAQQLALIANANAQGEAAAAAALDFAFSAQALIGPATAARTMLGLSGLPELRLDADGCEVIGPSSVVWNHCTNNGVTIDGMISWSTGHVDVDIHASGTSGTVTVDYSLTGSVTVSATAVHGDMTVSLAASNGSASYSQKVETQIDVQIANGCISGGTLTVTATGSGNGTRTGAVQVIWSGCNAFRVRNG